MELRYVNDQFRTVRRNRIRISQLDEHIMSMPNSKDFFRQPFMNSHQLEKLHFEINLWEALNNIYKENIGKLHLQEKYWDQPLHKSNFTLVK